MFLELKHNNRPNYDPQFCPKMILLVLFVFFCLFFLKQFVLMYYLLRLTAQQVRHKQENVREQERVKRTEKLLKEEHERGNSLLTRVKDLELQVRV